jgi:hypothetical protein
LNGFFGGEMVGIGFLRLKVVEMKILSRRLVDIGFLSRK